MKREAAGILQVEFSEVHLTLLACALFVFFSYKQWAEVEAIVRFIEWNWLSGKTGYLNTRDKIVNNIGDLLDSNETGVEVPIH